MTAYQLKLLAAVGLVVIAASLRLVPHPDNFAPIAAVAIFGGALLPTRLTLVVPLSAMAVTDLIIGLHDLVVVTWGCYLLVALASHHLLKKRSLARGLGVIFGASTFFFIVTNFAVWLSSGMYAHTLSGLTQCYTMALPFLRNTLLSDLVYTGLLFGAFMVVRHLSFGLVMARKERLS